MKEPLISDRLHDDIDGLRQSFVRNEPFNHVCIDNFFQPEIAQSLAAEIEAAAPNWHRYQNAIEIKQTCNLWNEFPSLTYKAFSYLTSDAFVSYLRDMTGYKELVADVGLHGGGLHRHGRGGKLNTHLDYSLHPKTGMQRKLNLIVYLSQDWDPSWGGGLGLWSHDAQNNKPAKVEKVIDCLFNRGVLFDTTQNSWHGLPDPIECAENRFRSSIAVYYMVPPAKAASAHDRAQFAPHNEQAMDPAVMDLIRMRSASATAASVYRTK